jgi:hypothetical protein
LIGQVETTLGTIVGSKEFTFRSTLIKPGNKEKRGEVTVKVVPLQESTTDISLKLGARDLPYNTSCFCINQIAPFVVISKSFQAGGKYNFVQVFKTEVNTSETNNPTFPVFRVKSQALCYADHKAPIRFQFYNQIPDNPPLLLGHTDQSVNQMIEKREFPIVQAETRAAAGFMIVEDLKVHEKPTFLQYLRSGWGISLSVAIDYTGSNGDYLNPSSLHYLGGYNQYEQAIRSVGTVLENYDSDKKFPVYGFGGVPRFIPNHMQVSHCFPLNGNYNDPEVYTTEGILQLYRQNLQVRFPDSYKLLSILASLDLPISPLS